MSNREPVNLLFVCSMNQWRSPTAEKIFSKRDGFRARSAGTSQKAKRTVSSTDIKWADVVLVMESKHRQRLLAQFPGEMRFKETHVLHIPDEYQFMDPELIEELSAAVDSLLMDR